MPAIRAECTPVPRSAFHFCLDNSASMGRSTAEARDCFAELVAYATEPCSLTVFANRAEVLGDSLAGPADVRELRLPGQGQTDISSGVKRSMELIVGREAAEPGAVHHVLFLLSDGQHNVGPSPASTFPKLAREVRAKAPLLRLSMVVIGISANSRTCDGMLGRVELETVPLHGLEPIYFASSSSDMAAVLQTLEAGIASLADGRVVRLELPAAGGAKGFVRVPGEAPLHALEAFASGGSQMSVVVQADAAPGAVLLDGSEVALAESAFDCTAALAAIHALIGALRERRVGSFSFDGSAAFDFLDPCIRAVAEFQEAHQATLANEAEATGPAARLRRHKALSAAHHDASRLRNQLQEALAFHSNDSAEQARFLTGAGQKHAMLCSDSSERRHLPDVREADTLSQIAVRLRMDTYGGRVAEKMSDWRAVALDVTAARARAADIGQFSSMLGDHAHGLSKGAFWGLWSAARSDGSGGDKVMAFLAKANSEFANKYGSPDCSASSR